MNPFRMTRVLKHVSALAILLTLLLLSPRPALAATIVVNVEESDFFDTCTIESCSLSGAVAYASQHPGKFEIKFDIPGSGVHRIPVEHSLNVPDGTTIDGYSQPGSSPNTLTEGNDAKLRIELDANHPNLSYAVKLGSDLVVRGLAIYGAKEVGVKIQGDKNWVTGSFIGFDASGFPIGNAINGIEVKGNYNNIGFPQPAFRNVVSATYVGSGIALYGKKNTVQNNYIGTTPQGAASFGNKYNGIAVVGGGKNIIGGKFAGERNVLSGNGQGGIALLGTNKNIVKGNYIGVDRTGNNGVPNLQWGIYIKGSKNKIGGIEAGEGNLIAFNEGNGVVVAEGARNIVRGNSIFSNLGLGIDLDDDGITKNDRTDGDGGANEAINFPAIKFAHALANGTRIKLRLKTIPDQVFAVQFYATPSCNSHGYGEGRTFLGSLAVWTDATGEGILKPTFADKIPLGHVITATTTDGYGNTSEFSTCAVVVSEN